MTWAALSGLNERCAALIRPSMQKICSRVAQRAGTQRVSVGMNVQIASRRNENKKKVGEGKDKYPAHNIKPALERGKIPKKAIK